MPHQFTSNCQKNGTLFLVWHTKSYLDHWSVIPYSPFATATMLVDLPANICKDLRIGRHLLNLRHQARMTYHIPFGIYKGSRSEDDKQIIPLSSFKKLKQVQISLKIIFFCR